MEKDTEKDEQIEIHRQPETTAAGSFFPSRVMPKFGDIIGPVGSVKNHSMDHGSEEFVKEIVRKIASSNHDDRSDSVPTMNLDERAFSQRRKMNAIRRKSPVSKVNNHRQGRNEVIAAGAAKVFPDEAQQISEPIDLKKLSVLDLSPPSPQRKVLSEIVAKEIIALITAEN